jgi:DNA-binding transcriptional ArsR family regulator
MAKKKIPEIRYRASRICRVLGNPTAYELLHILQKGKKTPYELARMLGVSITTVSHVLRSLRQLDLIRYEVKHKQRIYWIKETSINTAMILLEQLIKKIKTKEY